MTGHKLENANDDLIMVLAVSEMLEIFGRKLEEEYKNMNDIPDDPETKSQGLFNHFYKEVTFCGLHHEAYA